MSAAAASLPAEHVAHPTRPIANVPGRLGLWPLNLGRAQIAMPWKRRLRQGCIARPQGPLLGKAIHESDRRSDARQEHGAARQGTRKVGSRRAPTRGVRPRERGDSACARYSSRSTCRSPPARSCTSAGSSNSRPAKARRSRRRSPTFLNALVGKGVHVTTVNDYLAQRDADWIGPVYQKLGLSVGVSAAEDGRRGPHGRVPSRRDLRHRLGVRLRLPARPAEGPRRAGRRPRRSGCPWMPGADAAKMDPRVQRALHFAIVDEADSIFIDEAKTPLIIANPTRLAEPEEQVVLPLGRPASRGP